MNNNTATPLSFLVFFTRFWHHNLMFSFEQLPAVSLYIHFPWCIQKCPYCDFNSHTLKSDLPEDIYINQLIADFRQSLVYLQNRPIKSIFCGGGTPSLFSPQAISRLLHCIFSEAVCEPDIEITLEANPGTFESEKFSGFYQAGVNRLSLGIQSLDAQQLKNLGRIHDPDQALTAISTARACGFDNFNCDLMYGLSHQTPKQALSDLEQILNFKPPHISWYQLTLEPNTAFYKNPPKLPDHDTLWEIESAGKKLLTQNNYNNYEISAHAQPDHPSQHNINYWEFNDYLGIGAGAHGKITLLDQQKIIRTQKTRYPRDYLINHAPVITELTTNNFPFEYLLNRLRLAEPMHLLDYQLKTGLKSDSLTKAIVNMPDLININNNCVTLTPQGRKFTDEILKNLLG